MHRNGRRRETVENRREPAVADLVGDHVGQGHRDPIPRFRRGDGRDRVVDFEPWNKGNAVSFVAVEKAPLLVRHEASEGDHGVETKVGGGPRNAAPREIIGTCDKYPSNGPDFFRDQTGIRQGADADGKIDPFFHEVGDTIEQEHRHGDARVLVEKGAHHWREG